MFAKTRLHGLISPFFRQFLFAPLGLLLLVSCASEQVRQEREALAQIQAERLANADPNDPISCRRVQLTGTTFRQKICRTRSEWAGVNSDRTSAEEFTRGIRENSAVMHPSASPGVGGTMGSAVQMGL